MGKLTFVEKTIIVLLILLGVAMIIHETLNN